MKLAEPTAHLSYMSYEGPIGFCKKYPDAKFFHAQNHQCYIVENHQYMFVVVRGTELSELKDLRTDLKVKQEDTQFGRVHSGFLEGAHSINRVISRYVLQRLGETNKQLVLCGHSMGGAVALLLAPYFTGLHNPIVYTFGAPQVCNKKYKKHYSRIVPNVCTIINDSDPIPRALFWMETLGEDTYYISNNGNVIMNPSKWKRWKMFLWDTSRINDHPISEYLKRIRRCKSCL